MKVDRLPGPHDLQMHYACGVCGANIRVRVVVVEGQGSLRSLCDGPEGHDVEQTRNIVAKATRDLRLRQQEADADEVIEGLPPELRALVLQDERRQTCR